MNGSIFTCVRVIRPLESYSELELVALSEFRSVHILDPIRALKAKVTF